MLMYYRLPESDFHLHSIRQRTELLHRGLLIEVDDSRMPGRQIREKVLVTTTSGYSLIMVANHGAQSIGLDRVVDICEARDSKFRHFEERPRLCDYHK